MEIVVDIIRGEGAVEGKPWPSHLVLGQDAIADIREKARKLEEVVDEWEWTGRAVSYE
jgi:hypothetical protein